MLRTVAALIAALGVAACASAPLAPPSAPPTPAGPSFEQKMSWILRLEDQRILHDVEPAEPPAAEPTSAPTTPGGKTPVPTAAPAPPPSTPDLLRLLRDDEARVRRRAALAVGRVGLPEGAPGLLPLLADLDAEVRQMAACAGGRIGAPGAREPLVLALRDPSPLVRGSAAEALGLLGDPSSADAVAEMARAVVESGALAEPPGDDADVRRDTPVSAFRLALAALVRLKAYGALASVVLEGTAQPRSTWWPVAFALERIGDARAGPALLRLAGDAHPYTRVFAIRGLGALKIREAVPLLLPLVDGRDRVAAIEAIHALGLIGDRSAGPALMKIVQAADADAAQRAEAVLAVGGVRPDGAFDTLLDVLGDPSPLVRAAAIGSLARLDPEGFVTVLAGIDPDPHWSVRVALAAVLGTLTPEAGLPRLRAMLSDADTRVLPAVLRSLARLRAPEAGRVLVERLAAEDVVVRKAAADALRALKPDSGVAALASAYEFGRLDASYAARAAALDAAAAYGADAATPVLQTALADRDWAVRRTAASWLRTFDPASDALQRIRPALSASAEFYQTPRLVDPSVSTQVYIDTDRGSIQLELAVLDAPLTVENFVTLARKGFFNGLSFHRVLPGLVQGGEPRGDGEGGPGYTMRDEVNQRPVLRGAVAMAADAVDAAGSQFLIARAPLPDLDARVTVFARVVAGMEVVDDVQPWDVIRRVRIWDGETPR